jgi:hypothetical protein
MVSGLMAKSREQLAEYARKYRAKNLEKKRAYEKEYYDKTPDQQKEKRRKYTANWLAKNPNANRNKHYKKRYGITVEEYESMAKAQNYLCAICERPETKTRKDGTVMILCVDHNHLTGQVRDLLCNKCNILLGHLETGNVTFSQLIHYLKKHSDRTWPESPELDCD